MNLNKNLILVIVASAAISSLVTLGLTGDQNSSQSKPSLYDQVMQNGKIRCAYALIEPGIFKNPNTGQLSGIAYDLMNKIGENLKLEVEWTEEYGVGEVVTVLESKKADMICTGLWISSARARAVDFTDILFFFPATIWTRADDRRFDGTLESFKKPNVKFSAIEGSTSINLAKRFFPENPIHALPEMSSIAESFMAVSSGKADASILTVFNGLRFQEANPNQIRNALEKPLRNDPAAMLIPRGEFEFRSMINTAIGELVYSGYVDELIKKYSPYPDSIYPRAQGYREATP